MLSCLGRPSSYDPYRKRVDVSIFLYEFLVQVLLSKTMKQNDRQNDGDHLKILVVRGECFAPHLALTLKSEWHKFHFDSFKYQI